MPRSAHETADHSSPCLWVQGCGGLAVLLVLASVSCGALVGWGLDDYITTYTLTNLAIGVALAGSGVMIGWYRPRNAVGVLFAVGGLAHLVSAACSPMGQLGLEQEWPIWTTRLMAGLFLSAWGLGLPTLAVIALVLFPDGRPPSRPWWAAVWYVALTGGASFLLGMLNPAELVAGVEATRPLFAVDGIPVAELELVLDGVMAVPVPFLLVGALVVRYLHGGERVRRQVLWLILAVVGIVAINAQRVITGEGPILLLMSTVLIPVAIAIAIIRYQLLDIRLVLSRTLLYGVLIALVIALYAGLVALLTLIVPREADRTVAALAAVAVALLFNPLRILLQRTVSRALFGARDEVARTVAGVRPDAELGDVLAQLRRTLRLPRLAVEVGGQEVAADGVDLADATSTRLPVGGTEKPEALLVVALRSGERRLHPADRRALALVLPSIGLLLRERTLSRELRRARAQTVLAREHERKTLHRDLHDGLGPTLTGAVMRLDAAANLLETNPLRSREALLEARDDVRLALDDVRRVAYGLRPIALDEKGLLGALQEEARRIQTPRVTIEAPAELPALSPAVELAAYRVAMEAITNARRHSGADVVTVRLDADASSLRLSIADDGVGGEAAPGAGIRSLRERVEELGGTSSVGPVPTGWQVEAGIPLA